MCQDLGFRHTRYPNAHKHHNAAAVKREMDTEDIQVSRAFLGSFNIEARCLKTPNSSVYQVYYRTRVVHVAA